MDFSFSQFSIFFQKDLETDDTSFESPKIELLESEKKLGAASPWGWQLPYFNINMVFFKSPFYSFALLKFQFVIMLYLPLRYKENTIFLWTKSKQYFGPLLLIKNRE